VSSGKPLTVTDLETIKKLFDAGRGISETAKEIGRNPSIINRAYRQIKNGTFLKRVAETQQREVEMKKNGKAPRSTTPGSKWASLSTEQRRRICAKLRSKGLSVSEVAHKLGTQTNNLSYYFYQEPAAKAKREAKAGTASTYKINKIHALKAEGLTGKQIAEKLKLPYTVVHYQLYKPQPHGKEQTNGAATSNRNGNGAVSTPSANENILIGFAFAETERFIGLLGERLRISTEVLRPRLSKLLGHSPLRP
jgi:transposase-like protein